MKLQALILCLICSAFASKSLQKRAGCKAPLSDQQTYAFYDVDVAKWRIYIIWDTVTCKSVIMKVSVNNAPPVIAGKETCLNDNPFCVFPGQRAYCDEEGAPETTIWFYSIGACARKCPFTTKVVVLKERVAAGTNPCKYVYKGGKRVLNTDREYSACGQVKTCYGPKLNTRGPGCFCKSGYEDDEGNCITVETKDCPAGKMFQPCGGHYHRCVSGKSSPENVTEPGCFCDSGYTLSDGSCLDTICSAGKVFKPCGGTVTKCNSESGEESKVTDNNPGCYCQSGIEDENGNCLPGEMDCSIEGQEFMTCGQENICILSNFTRIISKVHKPGCYCTAGWLEISGEQPVCTDICPQKPEKQPLNVVATADCGSNTVTISYKADTRRKYSYSLYHGDNLVREGVAPTTGIMKWPKNGIAVGLYEITITDDSAEHSESASFVVTYEQKTNFDDGSGELTLYAYPFVEGVTVIFAASANVTYQCGIGEAPSDCTSPYVVHNTNANKDSEFTILVKQEGKVMAQDSFNIRV